MVASLSISLNSPGTPRAAAPAHAAIAKVHSLGRPFPASASPKAELAAAVAHEVIVPGFGNVDLPVAPGLYNVQLILPTGRILQENCEVGEGQNLELAFSDDPEAGGPFSLQGLVGLDDPSAVLNHLVKSRPPSAEPDILLDPPTRGGGGLQARSVDIGSVAAAMDPPPQPPILHIGSATMLSGSQGWSALAPSAPKVLEAGNWAELACEARQQCAALWHVPDASQSPGPRRWGVVQAHGSTELFSVPLPWRRQMLPDAKVEVTVDPCAVGRAMTSVGICDPELEGLLGYFDRGRLGSARPIIEALDAPGHIRDLILRKLESPLAACAAAYVGLAIFDPGEQEGWDDWLPNIMNLFPDIPDGAIVHARRIILRPSGPEENEEALAALKTAYAAGVPYYGVGLQLMREMLSFFPNDEEACRMREKVAQVASRVDSSQIFTVLRYPAPAA